MRGKQRKNYAKANSRPPLRKNEKFAKNKSYIQRSKQMEELQRKTILVRKTTADRNQEMDTALDLLPLQDDNESAFYEQLVSGYQLKTVFSSPSILTSVSTVSTKSNSDELPDNININKHDISETSAPEFEVHKVFAEHFNFKLDVDNVEDIVSKELISTTCSWAEIGDFKIESPKLSIKSVDYSQPPKSLGAADLQKLGIKSNLCANITSPLTALQSELFSLVCNYQDLYYPNRTHDNAEEIRYIYCLHALNHLLVSRSLILRNNEKVSALAKLSNLPPSEVAIPDKYRDQGLKRTKVLIVLPFRDSAFRTVKIMENLLFVKQNGKKNDKNGIAKYERFVEEYTGNSIYFPKTNPKPSDYEQTFSGNTDDNFKLGIRFTKKSISLYADLDTSDIIIASPLAIRMLIDDKKDFDFLNSIELLIIDQAELFLAQNWENLIYVLDHLHLQPQKFPDTNCQRVRSWCLSGVQRYYRQTLLFTSHELPEFRSLLSSKCANFQGKVRTTNVINSGAIRNVLTPIQQIFQRIDNCNIETVFEDRFEFFVKEVLPKFTASGHCFLYVPSYFDYVRLRNHFIKEMISFVQISEYTKKEKISRARDIFFHSGASILLYSERAHFFRRTRVKGIRHLIMYQPPNYPHFYSELINLMLDFNQNPRDGLQDSMSVTVLYTKYDLLSLSNIVGSENAVKLTRGNKNSYLFSTKT